MLRHWHTTLLRRWINVIDVDSTSQQRRVPVWHHRCGSIVRLEWIRQNIACGERVGVRTTCANFSGRNMPYDYQGLQKNFNECLWFPLQEYARLISISWYAHLILSTQLNKYLLQQSIQEEFDSNKKKKLCVWVSWVLSSFIQIYTMNIGSFFEIVFHKYLSNNGSTISDLGCWLCLALIHTIFTDLWRSCSVWLCPLFVYNETNTCCCY